jgi:hypothetical protein
MHRIGSLCVAAVGRASHREPLRRARFACRNAARPAAASLDGEVTTGESASGVRVAVPASASLHCLFAACGACPSMKRPLSSSRSEFCSLPRSARSFHAEVRASSFLSYNPVVWRNGVGLCWGATPQGIARPGRQERPAGPGRLPLRASWFLSPLFLSPGSFFLPCHASQNPPRKSPLPSPLRMTPNRTYRCRTAARSSFSHATALVRVPIPS